MTSLLHVLTFPHQPAVHFLAGHGLRLAGFDVLPLSEDLQLVNVVRRLGDNLCRPIAPAGDLDAPQVQVVIKVEIVRDVPLFCIGALDIPDVFSEGTENLQPGWEPCRGRSYRTA